MSVLSDETILVRLTRDDLMYHFPTACSGHVYSRPLKRLVIEPLDMETQVQPCSVDLRLEKTTIIKPGEFVLASTLERVEIPDDLLGRVCGRSSIGRLGIQVENAGLIDPGFRGQITLELVNFSSVERTLPTHLRICQITFEFLTSPALRPYGHPSRKSKYQDQKGVTESRLE